MLSQILAVTAVNIRSIPQRLGSSAVAIVGICGVVVVFTGVLSIAEGSHKAMSETGDPQTVIVGGLARPVLEAIVARMVPLARSVSSDRPHPIDRVVLAAMVDTPALGAATLPIFDSINPEFSLLLGDEAGQLAAD